MSACRKNSRCGRNSVQYDTFCILESMNYKAILSGWEAFMNKSEVTEKLAKERAVICSGCEHAVKSKLVGLMGDDIVEVQGYKCSVCSCPLSAKIRQSIEPCPVGKWK